MRNMFNSLLISPKLIFKQIGARMYEEDVKYLQRGL